MATLAVVRHRRCSELRSTWVLLVDYRHRRYRCHYLNIPSIAASLCSTIQAIICPVSVPLIFSLAWSFITCPSVLATLLTAKSRLSIYNAMYIHCPP